MFDKRINVSSQDSFNTSQVGPGVIDATDFVDFNATIGQFTNQGDGRFLTEAKSFKNPYFIHILGE